MCLALLLLLLSCYCGVGGLVTDQSHKEKDSEPEPVLNSRQARSSSWLGYTSYTTKNPRHVESETDNTQGGYSTNRRRGMADIPSVMYGYQAYNPGLNKEEKPNHNNYQDKFEIFPQGHTTRSPRPKQDHSSSRQNYPRPVKPYPQVKILKEPSSFTPQWYTTKQPPQPDTPPVFNSPVRQQFGYKLKSYNSFHRPDKRKGSSVFNDYFSQYYSHRLTTTEPRVTTTTTSPYSVRRQAVNTEGNTNTDKLVVSRVDAGAGHMTTLAPITSTQSKDNLVQKKPAVAIIDTTPKIAQITSTAPAIASSTEVPRQVTSEQARQDVTMKPQLEPRRTEATTAQSTRTRLGNNVVVNTHSTSQNEQYAPGMAAENKKQLTTKLPAIARSKGVTSTTQSAPRQASSDQVAGQHSTTIEQELELSHREVTSAQPTSTSPAIVERKQDYGSNAIKKVTDNDDESDISGEQRKHPKNITAAAYDEEFFKALATVTRTHSRGKTHEKEPPEEEYGSVPVGATVDVDSPQPTSRKPAIARIQSTTNRVNVDLVSAIEEPVLGSNHAEVKPVFDSLLSMTDYNTGPRRDSTGPRRDNSKTNTVAGEDSTSLCRTEEQVVFVDRCEAYKEETCHSLNREECTLEPVTNCSSTMLLTKVEEVCLTVTDNICSLVESEKVVWEEEIYLLESCAADMKQVCDQSYKLEVAEQVLEQCVDMETVNCRTENVTLSDTTCTEVVKFNCHKEMVEGKSVCEKSVSNNCISSPREVEVKSCRSTSIFCRNLTSQQAVPVMTEICRDQPTTVCRMMESVRPVKRKGFSYLVSCKMVEKEECKMMEQKKLEPRCTTWDRPVCQHFLGEESCKEEEKEYCYKQKKVEEVEVCEDSSQTVEIL